MRVSYHPDYWIPLPERHPFPMGKYPAEFPMEIMTRNSLSRNPGLQAIIITG